MADDNTIIEGTVKFRDGKKWKPRWCVVRRLSPVADSVQLQLYRDARARSRRLGRPAAAAGGASGAEGGALGGVKASLSLQHYLGCEAGFTLDKHSNTLALVCQDFVAVLAFETRERLLQWQVKVVGALGEAQQWLVLVTGGEGAGAGSRAGGRAGGRPGGAVPPGPARLHLHADRAALTAGLPPRLLAVWEIRHLRRFGVVEGRFCLEGGARSGAGALVLAADAARDIAAAFQRAARARLAPRRPGDGTQSPDSHREFRSVTRLSEDEAECTGEGWATAERGEDALSLSGAGAGPGAGPGAGLARCASCMAALGALSRSSTAALTPGARPFSPAWTMQPAPACRCAPPPHPPQPPQPPRPPRGLALPRLELTLSRKPNRCDGRGPCEDRTRIGPYENYDVPKALSTEVEGEYYDTPKRLRESFGNLFQIARSTTSDAVILKKPCGCLLKFGRRRREPTVVEAGETAELSEVGEIGEVGEVGEEGEAACVCHRVTAWAEGWLRAGKENLTPNGDGRDALYATVDFSRKTRGRARDDSTLTPATPSDSRHLEIDDGPLANYENLNFALSLEYYENARDLLRRVGVTQAELDAIGASLRRPFVFRNRCSHCGRERRPDAADDYLTMTPGAREDSQTHERGGASVAGYAPMSPLGGFTFNSLRLPARSPGGGGPLDEKSASNPTLGASDERVAAKPGHGPTMGRIDRRKRSSSADSSRFLDDVEEYEAGGSASSLETLRGAETARARPGAGCGCGGGGGGAPAAAANRDSSSSADSGVSGCRRSRSAGGGAGEGGEDATRGDQSSSGEAEVPALPMKPLGGVADSRSTSSGASDMSDYIETLSLCSSHSSTDTPVTLRMTGGAQTSTLRPRSGAEYRAAPRLAPAAPPAPAAGLYSNLP